jgi:hypothetical protein
MVDTCFRINSPSVIHERFEDELVAVHLDHGAYYSLTGAAADAFVLFSEEATAIELADALAGRYAATSEQILTSLHPFLEQLLREKLIAPVDTRKPRGPLRAAGSESGLPFVPPTVQAYHDLESLFLIDPIHEVGDQGWPSPPSGPLET